MKNIALIVAATMLASVPEVRAGSLYTLDPRLSKPVLHTLSNFTNPASKRTEDYVTGRFG